CVWTLVFLDVDTRDALCRRQIAEELNELLERPTGRGDGLARRDGPVRLDVEDQAIAIGHLFHSSVLHRIRDPFHGREDRVDRDHPDRVTWLLVAIGHAVADAALDRHLHLEGTALADGGDVQIWIEDLDPRGRR